ncbi:Zinc finger C3H1 domain-containing protein [Halotydeus destructor]|nr:Zinc finger C3H1 domain-containing protein [Halotydeus destructor]
MQHKSKYLLTDAEKVVDILLYNPSVASRNLSKDETQLRTELLEFVNLYLKKEEHNSMHLIKLVRNSDQIKNHTLPSIRRHLTRFMQKRYTFHDFSYQIKLRDRRLVLTYNKLLSMKEIPDPDLVTGTRFYMTSSFEEQAESILAENPRDTQLWIKFAYRKLRENEDDKNIRMVEALKILSRGLKHNSSDSELWENYIFLYSNCQFKTKPEKAKPKLLDICRQAVEICPTYRLWKCYVSHCFTADEKTQSSHDLIQVLVRRCLSISDDEELSHCILEAVLYRVRLHLQIGRPERAETLLRNGLVYSDLKVPPFNCALDVIKYVENCEEIQELPSRSVKTLPISKLLTVSDKVFLWISYLYLISSQRLPSYFSEPFRQSYSGIQSKDMPLLSWDHVKSETVYRTLLEAFAAAYWHCFTTETEVRTKNKFDAVSGLSANLWQLEISWRKNNAAIVDLFLELLANSKLLDLDKSRFFWSLMADAQLGAGKSTTALETIKKTKFFNSGDQSFLYLAAYISFECKDIKSLENCMRKAVRPYIDDDLSASKMADIDQVYRAVLFESSSLDVAVAEIRMKYVKYPVKSVKLWLCYIFYKILSGGSRSRISSFFTMALAMCEMVEIEEEMHLLWIAKFKYLARAVKTSSDFEEFTNQLKHCCLMTKSSLFQMKLIILFSSLIKKTSERCKFVISLSRVIPQNVDLISFAVRQCLANGEPQLVLDYLNQLINEKKQLYFNDEIWKTLIALSVDRDDHYHAHWYFETAISLYPYNAAIWDLALKYERSHGHSDHLKQLRGQYDKLKLPNATNLL